MLLPFNLHMVELPFWIPTAHTNMIASVISFPQENDSSTKQPASNMETNLNVVDSNTVSYNLQEDTVSNSPPFTKFKGCKKKSPNRSLINNITLLLPLLWILGMSFFLLYQCLTYLAFLKKLKRWKIPVTNKETKQVLTRLSAELKIVKNIKVEVCKFVSSPMMVGVLHPKIVLPSEDFTTVQMSIILKHELIHYIHHDLYFKFLLLFVNAIHWFNPVVYYMVKYANHDIELVCDEAVVWKQDEEYRRTYSSTILQIITRNTRDKCISFSTYLHGGKKQIKHRFSQIMNESPKKKGIAFFAVLLCSILLTGNLVAYSSKTIDAKSSLTANTVKTQISKNTDIDNLELKEANNILFVGTDGSNENLDPNHADSIILVTIQTESKSITITSFLRDMYLEIPTLGNNKLNAAYTSGGIDLLKRTLETNFDFTVNGTVEVDFSGFENIMNQLGAIKLTLTEKEASYLNSTNYISNPANRTLIVGEQLLNGNQALGYARIRYIENSDGLRGDLGRTARQQDILLAVYEKCKASDFMTLLSILDTTLSYVTSDFDKDQITSYLYTAFESGFTFNSLQVPAEGTYESAKVDGMSVLDTDISANQEKLKKIIEP